MSVYMTKEFARFARKAGLENDNLMEAATDVAGGHYDADLGGGVFKQRVARPGGGKSGGFRTIILFRIGGHSFFAHGFAKSDKANVSPRELKALKRLAEIFLAFSTEEIAVAENAGQLVKVTDDGNEDQEG